MTQHASVSIDDLFAPSAPATRAATGLVTSANADIAVVALPGDKQGYLSVADWYPGRQLPAVNSYVTAMVAEDGFKVRLTVLDDLLPQALIEGLVPEMQDGRVRVMGVAREAGRRTKIAVASTVDGLDPVTATIGRRANRVKEVSRQMRGEQIDVIAWASTKKAYVANSLAPVGVERVERTETGFAAMVARHQVSAAVGASGLNARLASMLVGADVVVRPAD